MFKASNFCGGLFTVRIMDSRARLSSAICCQGIDADALVTMNKNKLANADVAPSPPPAAPAAQTSCSWSACKVTSVCGGNTYKAAGRCAPCPDGVGVL